MKIVKRVGEQLLPDWIRAEVRPVLVFTGAGNALAAGSRILVRRGWESMRDRLHGWELVAAPAGALYVVMYSCTHAPRHVVQFAIPGAVIAWCVAAWWIAPPAAAEPDETAEATALADGFELWLLDLIGDRPGIHLRDLYPAMRELPGHEGRDNAQLRAALRALGIPVRRSLRLGGVAGRSGVARADLRPLRSPSGESSGEIDGDAGQPADSPAGESAGERLESA